TGGSGAVGATGGTGQGGTGGTGGVGNGGVGGAGGQNTVTAGTFDMSNTIASGFSNSAGITIASQNSGIAALIQQSANVQANLAVR
ncbi:MAG TPA: hypothetical protein VGE10_15275, partial [Zeimonas sp.]